MAQPMIAERARDLIAECLACGALVSNADQHGRWHAPEQAAQSAGDEVVAFLERLDTAEWQRVALQRVHEHDGDLTLTMKLVAMEWARGGP